VSVECFFTGDSFEVLGEGLLKGYLKGQAGIVIFLSFYFFRGFCSPGGCFTLGVKCTTDGRVPFNANGCRIAPTVFCSTFLEKDSMKQQKIAREDERQEDTKKGFIPLLLG